METRTSMQTDVIAQLIALQELDRVRDRLQRRLDEVPQKLRKHTDAIAALEGALQEQERLLLHLRADTGRAELDLKVKEEEREKIKRNMNAPKLSNREYEILQEQLAGVLADISSLSDKALKGMEGIATAEATLADLRGKREESGMLHAAEKEKLEGALSGVTAELEKRTAERAAMTPAIDREALEVYERVRRKHPDALAVMDGTIDRAAGRIANDVHCAACYIGITPNDAVQVLGRKRLVQCKSCVRVLYVP